VISADNATDRSTSATKGNSTSKSLISPNACRASSRVGMGGIGGIGGGAMSRSPVFSSQPSWSRMVPSGRMVGVEMTPVTTGKFHCPSRMRSVAGISWGGLIETHLSSVLLYLRKSAIWFSTSRK
jgi:hypothetical protein